MRFAAAHKLVTYLLVLAALAAVASTRALAPASALLFLAACGLSFYVESGNRAALLLDRAAVVVRAAAIVLFAVIGWRLWRRLPDPDAGPAFDLVLALLGYKLFFRRIHRDYIHVAALTFLLVLVASTIAHSFVFVATFAFYVVVAVWALILFHLRREMEENYLIKHSAQAPSQKVGVGRILGSRRVVGGTFFAATAGMAAVVFVGAVTIFMLVPRVGAGFAVGVTRLPGSATGFADEIAIGRYGTRPAHRREVVLRVTFPERAEMTTDAADHMYFRGAAYDGYEVGRWVHSHRPELRTNVEADGPRFVIGEGGEDRSLAGATRQDVEAIGIPASVLVALDRPRAFELPATKLGAAGALRVFPRWSGEAALRVGAGEGDTFLTLSHAHYVAYSLPGSSRAGASPPLAPAARAAYLVVPEDLRRRLVNLAATIGPPEAGAADLIESVRVRSATSTATPWSRARPLQASTRSRASCWANARDIASCSRRRRCCCCGCARSPPATSPASAAGNGTRSAATSRSATTGPTRGSKRSSPTTAGCASTRRRRARRRRAQAACRR